MKKKPFHFGHGKTVLAIHKRKMLPQHKYYQQASTPAATTPHPISPPAPPPALARSRHTGVGLSIISNQHRSPVREIIVFTSTPTNLPVIGDDLSMGIVLHALLALSSLRELATG